MVRARRGRPVHGWLILDKPAGPSSAAMVARARRAFGAAKAGHAGTLDPAATGLLAIAFGEATKTVPAAAEGWKTYRFAVRWGAATATDDAEGAVLAESAARPLQEAVEAALGAFRGDILQTPPAVSAVKVGGARAYALTRAGAAPELAARPLHVARLELVGTPDRDTAVLEMVCGPGGYVRAVARDLGAALGCLGHVLWLRRLAAGPFDLEGAVAPATLEPDAPGLEALLRPVAAGLAGLREVAVTEAEAGALARGVAVAAADRADEGARVWASFGGRPVALCAVATGALRPDRVFVFD